MDLLRVGRLGEVAHQAVAQTLVRDGGDQVRRIAHRLGRQGAYGVEFDPGVVAAVPTLTAPHRHQAGERREFGQRHVPLGGGAQQPQQRGAELLDLVAGQGQRVDPQRQFELLVQPVHAHEEAAGDVLGGQPLQTAADRGVVRRRGLVARDPHAGQPPARGPVGRVGGGREHAQVVEHQVAGEGDAAPGTHAVYGLPQRRRVEPAVAVRRQPGRTDLPHRVVEAGQAGEVHRQQRVLRQRTEETAEFADHAVPRQRRRDHRRLVGDVPDQRGERRVDHRRRARAGACRDGRRMAGGGTRPHRQAGVQPVGLGGRRARRGREHRLRQPFELGLPVAHRALGQPPDGRGLLQRAHVGGFERGRLRQVLAGRQRRPLGVQHLAGAHVHRRVGDHPHQVPRDAVAGHHGCPDREFGLQVERQRAQPAGGPLGRLQRVAVRLDQLHGEFTGGLHVLRGRRGQAVGRPQRLVALQQAPQLAGHAVLPAVGRGVEDHRQVEPGRLVVDIDGADDVGVPVGERPRSAGLVGEAHHELWQVVTSCVGDDRWSPRRKGVRVLGGARATAVEPRA